MTYVLTYYTIGLWTEHSACFSIGEYRSNLSLYILSNYNHLQVTILTLTIVKHQYNVELKDPFIVVYNFNFYVILVIGLEEVLQLHLSTIKWPEYKVWNTGKIPVFHICMLNYMTLYVDDGLHLNQMIFSNQQKIYSCTCTYFCVRHQSHLKTWCSDYVSYNSQWIMLSEYENK